MTATWAGHTVPDDLWNCIIGGAYGNPAHMQVPPALLLALAWEESEFHNEQSNNINTQGLPGYDPVTGRELSFSPWQLNQQGVGTGYTAEQLSDLATARFLTVNHILTEIAGGYGLREAIGAWSTAGPAWDAYEANPIVEVTF